MGRQCSSAVDRASGRGRADSHRPPAGPAWHFWDGPQTAGYTFLFKCTWNFHQVRQQSPKPDAAPLLKQPNVPGEKHTARQADGRLEMPAWVPVLRDDGSPREPLPAPPPSRACLAHVDALSVSVFHHENPLPGSSPPSASPSLSSRALLLSLSPHSPSALLSACNCPSAARILGGAGVWGRAASSFVGRLGPD